MVKVNNFLQGTYTCNGNHLKKESSNEVYVIRNRQKVTPKKPQKYLIRLDTPKAEYISSLYGNEYKGYFLDYNQQKYFLEYTTTEEGLKAIIKPIGQ
jgi:hypothetical protein